MFFLKYFGVVFFDSTNDNNSYQMAYTVLLFVCSVSTFISLPWVVHEFDDWSDAFSTALTTIPCCTVYGSSLLSRAMSVYNAKYKYQKYKTTLEGFEIYLPATAVASNGFKRFSLVATSAYVAIVLPTNCLKLYYLYNNHPKAALMVTYFVFYYVQNLSLCFTELHFVIQCFVVYTKFRQINEQLNRIDDERNCDDVVTTAHPTAAVLPIAGKAVFAPTTSHRSDGRAVIVYERDFYHPRDRGCWPLANTIELLRIRHWLTREAVNDLNDLFGLRIGLSIVSIATAMLFDLYTEVFYTYTNTMFEKPIFRSNFLFFAWMLQYSFRFCIVVMTAHTSTQQVITIRYDF